MSQLPRHKEGREDPNHLLNIEVGMNTGSFKLLGCEGAGVGGHIFSTSVFLINISRK